MTFSISFLNRDVFSLLLVGLLLIGCGGRSPSVLRDVAQVVPQTLVVVADRSAPQTVDGGEIRWSLANPENLKGRRLRFQLMDSNGSIKTMQQGTAATWTWYPQTAGSYRIRVATGDAADQRTAGDWSAPYKIVPPLRVLPPRPDLVSPQAARTTAISWQTEASGGIEPLNYAFELEQISGIRKVISTGAKSGLVWRPKESGAYRFRVEVTDALGQRQSSDWSEYYQIAPQLKMESLLAERPAPQLAGQPIGWQALATGGVGPLEYRFELEKNGAPQAAVVAESHWSWIPEEAGDYRVRVEVRDARDNRQASAWSAPYPIVAPPRMEGMSVSRPSPQMAGSTSVTWRVAAAGGIGALSTTLELERDGGTPTVVQSGPETIWTWSPAQPGNYRLRATLEDSQGNRIKSSWYGSYQITAPLKVEAPVPGKPAPQAAGTRPIAWMIETSGGVEPLAYEFELEQDGVIQPKGTSGSLPGWVWNPTEAGVYRVRAAVIDLRGNRLESPWSSPYEIMPALFVEPPVCATASPQASSSVAISWTVVAGGGVGESRLLFELSREGAMPQAMQDGPAATWTWQPTEPGVYRVRVLLSDQLANQLVSDWSKPFVIEASLLIEGFTCDRVSPHTAKTRTITWSLSASGGVGPKSYAFELSRNGDVGWRAQQGSDKDWRWAPEQEGSYRVRAAVTDVRGNQIQSDWSKPYVIAPPLLVVRPEPDNTAAQYMLHSSINWTVTASGGVGAKTLAFLLEQQNGDIQTLQTGSAHSWQWRPEKAGFYRVQVLATDELGNQRRSLWSDWREVRGPLVLDFLTPSLPPSRSGAGATIQWRAGASGGLGWLSYEFLTICNGIESLEQTGPSAQWDWRPRKADSYRIKVRVRDEDNHLIESDWSDEYVITPALTTNSLIAVLPVQNLADAKAPMHEIGTLLRDLLQDDLTLLPSAQLEHFMAAQRMRYLGGIDSTLGEAFRTETGAAAVFITSLETWSEAETPRVSLISRVVTTGSKPEIVWIDSVGLSGDDAPGLLGLGRINSAQRLLAIGLERLIASYHAYLAGQDPYYRQAAEQQGARLIHGNVQTADASLAAIEGHQQPQFFYRGTSFDPARQYQAAVIPFLNVNARKHAGEILALHMVKQLNRYANIRVFEPGLLREALLRYRMIMQAGPSLAASDVLASAGVLGAELVVSGKVFDYQGEIGEPKADFSVQVFDAAKREVIWASRSYATGNQGVYFFDWGKVSSADALISNMTRAIVTLLED